MERAWETSTILEDFDSPKLINAKVCERCGNHYGIDKEICLCGNKLKEYNIVKGTVCPSCGRRSQPGTQPIAYPELSSFLVARTLTDFIYEELPLDYRKMLMFVDSRQHAERFTNTLEKDTHFRFNARRAIVNIIRAGETSFDNLYRNLKGLLISEYGGESELINDRSVLQVLADEITDGTHRSLERGVGIFEVDYKGLSEEELEEIIPKIATDKFRIELKYIYEISQGNTSKFLREVLTVLADDIRLRSAVKIEINGESNQLPITPRYSCCILAVDEKVESSYFKNIFGKRTKTYQLIKQIFMKYYPEIENTDIEIKEIVLSLLRILQYLDIIKLSTERDRNANRSLSVYFINEKKLIFRIPQRVWRCNKCFRFYAYNYLENKCLVPKCNGGLKECPTLNDEAQFKQSRNLYGNTYIKDPTRMIVEVDHGGVSHARRLKIESGFKAYPPEINIIISTPTLEVGIDIGDLEVVGLIRTPPTTSNYIQRTGRAGRKRRIAFCPTFAYDDPIDNYYFRYPIKLINGEIRPPPLNPSNFVLMERHIASIIFEYLLVESNLEMPSKMGELVDEGFDRRMIEFLWKTSVKGIIAQRVKNRFESISETDARFQNSVKSIDQGIEKYKQKIEKLEADSNKITKLFTQHLGRYTRKALIKQLDRIGGKIDSLKGKDVVQYFMESLVLPRYAFPGEFVEIFEKVLYKKPTRYRHQYGIWLNPLEPRESRMAIQEYVPGKHIRSGKILYLVEGISFEEKDKEDLFLCIICGWAQIGGIECDKCPKCQSKISTKTGIKPMSAILFKAKDINRNEIAIPRSYICAGEPSEKPIPTSYGKIEKYDEIDIITTVSKLRIHHPNGQQEDNEITICEECGSVYGGREPNHHKLDMGGNCNGDPIPDVALFNEFLTQGIIINLDKKILEDIGATDPTEREKLLITFKNALISASRIVVNCEDDELNGEILNDAFSLLLFDNVAGGAGYTREIYNELDDVIKRAMDIVYSCDCDIGCPECIYSSRRRYDAERIDKRVLKKLFDHWNQKEEDITLENEFMVNAIVIHSPSGDEKVPKLVRKFIEDSKNEIFGTSLYISDEPLFWSSGDEKSWATILSNKAKEDIDVDFVVRSPKSKSEESGVEKIISSGGNIKISSKVCEELEKFGISTSLGWNKVHTKLLAIDSNGKHPIGIITTANLSSDMFDNEETLIWFNERDAVKKLREIIQEILSKSNDVIS
ncbi:MAG: hypothetical protein A7315_09060 [Candidatus Altiarchaeales archaeon WOR_SM1_79]|nr:MAG: hypothetical protein A7315_09060 [Candidatus Altiarchaeales archaeon WOR_SM1_79]